MTEKKITILNLLVEMNEFRSERILTLSVFRLNFSRYLGGQIIGMDERELAAFKIWDSMQIEERTQVAIDFLKVESIKSGMKNSTAGKSKYEKIISVVSN